ncbi:MAG: hypothetical protein ACO3EZ_04550 [Prochlorotrichaceae cyanobacterium]
MKLSYLNAFPAALLVFGLSLTPIVNAVPLSLTDLPVTVTGTTGGNVSSSCGNIPAIPDLELNLDRASYLDVSVETTADATLWIDGPSDFCVLRDASTNQLHTAGHWPEGLYKVYVGDRQGTSLPFSLTISK